MTTSILVGAAALVLLAAFVQGAMGFGFGLVSMATLPLLLGVKETVPVVSCLGMTLNVVLLIQLRQDLSVRRIAPMALGGVFGIPLGVAFLKQADPSVLLAILGVIIIGLSLWLGREGAIRDRAPAWGVFAGFLGGMLGGAFNTGGPPVVAYAGSKPWAPREIRATLTGYFFLLSSFQICLFVYNDMLDGPAVRSAAQLALPLVLGAVVGDRLSSRLPPSRFRLLIRAGLGILGLVMLTRAVSTLLDDRPDAEQGARSHLIGPRSDRDHAVADSF